jgi:hypothetical protein
MRGDLKISILCASRGRPQRFAQMATSARETAETPADINVRLALDADDPMLDQYPIADHINPVRQPIAHLFNALAREDDGDILMTAGDDILFRTPGWDRKVAEVYARFPDGLFIASPMNGDGLQRVNHWFTGRQWVDVFGWFMPAHFEHFGDDLWVEQVAYSCGRLVFMRDVLIEHMHKKFRNANGTQKAPNDETYRAKREKAADGSCMSGRDEALFAKLAPQLAADAAKLRAALR